MASKIFISYRHGEDSGYAGRLFDTLLHSFGSDQLFMDVDNIEPGQDFFKVLEEKVAQSHVLLVVIGRRWIDAIDANGNRRLENPRDFVRIEIETALYQNKRVIPVLVDGAAMPTFEQLPESLQQFARCNAIRIAHDRYKSDSRRLIIALIKILNQPHPKTKPEKIEVAPEQKAKQELALKRRVEVQIGTFRGMLLSKPSLSATLVALSTALLSDAIIYAFTPFKGFGIIIAALLIVALFAVAMSVTLLIRGERGVGNILNIAIETAAVGLLTGLIGGLIYGLAESDMVRFGIGTIAGLFAAAAIFEIVQRRVEKKMDLRMLGIVSAFGAIIGLVSGFDIMNIAKSDVRVVPTFCFLLWQPFVLLISTSKLKLAGRGLVLHY